MSSLVPHGALAADLAAPGAAATLLAQAQALADPDASGLTPLRGKRLALLSTRWGDDAHRDFVAAATALGAQVSLVMPGLDEGSSAEQVQSIAGLLSQLYDAVECQHLPEALVHRIARNTNIPVFCGLALPEHPTAAMAMQLDAALPLAARRRYLLQAALLLGMAG